MINKLNKTFQSGNILTAAELNLLTAKIDEIINNWPSSTNPTNPQTPTTNTKASVRWITLEEFNQMEQNDGFENDVLYIVVDEDGKILFMYLNGNRMEYKEPEHSVEVPSQKITEEEWNALTMDQKKSKVWIIVAGDANETVIGIGTGGILTKIPIPASGITVKCSQEQYDAWVNAVPSQIVTSTLYFIEENDVIIKAYLGTKQLTLGSDNEGIVRSLVSEIWSQGVTWSADGTHITGIKGTMIDASQPGQLYATTNYQDLKNRIVSDSGFMSMTDVENNFARMYAEQTTSSDENNAIAKVAQVIARITKSGTSQVEINADDIIFGADKVSFDTALITALDAKLAVLSLSLTQQGSSSSVDLSHAGLIIHPDSNHTSVSLNADGSGFIANGNIKWISNGDITLLGKIVTNQNLNLGGSIGEGKLSITSNENNASIQWQKSSTNNNPVDVSITNQPTGISVKSMARMNEQGSIVSGQGTGAVTIGTYPNFGASVANLQSAGTIQDTGIFVCEGNTAYRGYTGKLNNLKFINGICVGAA